MGRVGADDLIVFRTAGAYAATMASTYNSRPLTAEVIVRGGEWAVVRERQDGRGTDPARTGCRPGSTAEQSGPRPRKGMVDRAGFEPAYGNPGRFTVCCL